MIRAAMFERKPVSGSRHKYRKMFDRVCDVTWGKFSEQSVTQYDIAIVEGDKCADYRIPLTAGVPYILVEQDIHSRRMGQYEGTDHEREMIENAAAMLLTTGAMVPWLAERYRMPRTYVCKLRPLAAELDFEPLPKLPGKNIVYSGGITTREGASGLYGYRSYHDIFARLQECGWTVHVYPAWGGADRGGGYARMGCVMHPEIPQGQLYRELSQYQAGFQGYAETGPQDYVKICRPNKLWEYLGAGIPTFGFNTGEGSVIYDGKWGHVAKSPDDFERVSKLVLKTKITDAMRRAEVIDSDEATFAQLVEIARARMEVIERHEPTVKLGIPVEMDGHKYAKGEFIPLSIAWAMKDAGLIVGRNLPARS